MRLCHISELPDGGARGFDPQRRGQDSLLLVRQGAHVHAWLDACPHHGTPMAWRKDAYLNAASDRIVCAAHGALFEIDTGLCTLGPCLGEHLQAVGIITWADGEIHIAAPAALETSE
jgi:nitrite reductase/ring-hydroxylating ferredoxin subunit